MRKEKRPGLVLLAMALALLIIVPAWTEGIQEGTPATPVLVLAIDTMDPKADAGGAAFADIPGKYFADFIGDLFRDATGAEIEVREFLTEDGSNKTIQVALMAGEKVDAIFGYTGRMGTWAVPHLAAPLDYYMSDVELAEWAPGALDQHTIDGHVYGLTATAWCQLAVVNVTVAEKTGLADRLPSADDIDRRWSVEDFEAMCKALPPGYFATTLFATKTGGDYWQLGWLSGFGAKLWDNGKIAINDEKGIRAVQWLADLRQYAPAGSAGNTYAEMISGWYAGKTLANGGSNGWALGLYNGFAEKKTEEQCEGLLINFPQLPGEVSQVAMGPNSAVVFLAAKDKPLAVELAKVLTGDVVQTMKSATGGRKPTRLGIPAPTLIKPENMPEYLVMQNAIETGGLFDLGMGNAHYGEIRAMWAVTLQAIFADRATVPEALEKFQNDANAILAY